MWISDGESERKMEGVRAWARAVAVLVVLVVVQLVGGVQGRKLQWADEEGGACKVWLVQSIPTDMPELKSVPGVLSTGEVLQWLAGNATKSLDITAQYWELEAQPNNPESGDYGYTPEQLEAFGAPVGQAVYNSLNATAERGVPIRIVQYSGFYPDYDQEAAALAAGRTNVFNRTLLLTNWWGSGIIHAKLWIANKEDAYVGSANNDWKSLTQVKEVGLYFQSCPKSVKLLEGFFNNFWALTELNASEHSTVVWDREFQLNRTVPCWSHYLEPSKRCKPPFPEFIKTPNTLGYPFLSDPYFFNATFETPGWAADTGNGTALAYVSVSPPEIASGHKYQTDIQGWLDTIYSVPENGTVRINTMDWQGQSEFSTIDVWWSEFSDAISKVVMSKNAHVKLIAATWAYTLVGTEKYLYYLNYTNALCHDSYYNDCSGTVEIKNYEVPGWQTVGPATNVTTGKPTGNTYPDFTRVNHAKFVVSDVRANIGTSNLVWDYFYNTAGVSFGTYDKRIVSQLQEIFDADWNSPYAVPFSPTSSL